MENKYPKTGEILIYKNQSGPEIQVSFEGETVWLSQAQMAALFGKDIRTISYHISLIYKENELIREKTTLKQGNSRNIGIALNKRDIFYNLDVIISVGYRVKSKRGTQFRIWATQRLRDYLLKGYLVNKDRLKDEKLSKVKELESAVQIIQAAIQNKRLDGYEKEVLNIITDYAATWTTLYQYDEDKLKLERGTVKIVSALHYEKVTRSILQFKNRLVKEKQAGDLFGKEQDEKLRALLGNIEQTYNSSPLYKTFEEKAAHLLYFAIKDHPFADGNKRIGSLLFILYLVENNRMYNKRGERIMNENALTALALLIAESNPNQKMVMVNLIASLIAKK